MTDRVLRDPVVMRQFKIHLELPKTEYFQGHHRNVVAFLYINSIYTLLLT